jgi:hypothetical protein
MTKNIQWEKGKHRWNAGDVTYLTRATGATINNALRSGSTKIICLNLFTNTMKIAIFISITFTSNKDVQQCIIIILQNVILIRSTLTKFDTTL